MKLLHQEHRMTLSDLSYFLLVFVTDISFYFSIHWYANMYISWSLSWNKRLIIILTGGVHIMQVVLQKLISNALAHLQFNCCVDYYKYFYINQFIGKLCFRRFIL